MGMNYQEQITVSFIDELEKIGEAKTRVGRAAAAGMNKRRVAAQWQSARARTAKHQPATSSLREAADAIDKVKVDSTAADIMKGVNAATAPAHAASAAADAAKPAVGKGLSNPQKAALIGGAAVGAGGTAYAVKKHRER